MNSANPTALIADDEPLLRDRLRHRLAALWPRLHVIGEAGDGDQALDLIETEQPDIAFLDIRMPGPDGLDVARRLAERGASCRVVFVTAHDDHAVEAFERAAVDYLLKPVSDERLQQCIERLRVHFDRPAADLSGLLRQLRETPSGYRQWIKATRGDEVHLLPVAEIDYFRAAHKYTSVYRAGREWLIRVPLATLEKELDPQQFWRIHRSTLVRVAAVRRAARDLAGRWFVELDGYKQALPVSRAHAHRFKVD